MDTYTEKTRAWLDRRFDLTDESGVFLAHQPIYGFRKGHSEPGFMDRYICTYHVMKALSLLEFDSLLDVGAAEGYKAFIAKDIFGNTSVACDLSRQACRRASEIFHLEAVVADIHDLPFGDDRFDVVLCSETLEHVADLQGAANELLRVARKAVVITVPHEAAATVARNVEMEVPHAHIHSLDTRSFDFLQRDGLRIIRTKMMSPSLGTTFRLFEAQLKEGGRLPALVVALYNRTLPLFRRLLGIRAVSAIIRADEVVCEASSNYQGLVFTLIKDSDAFERVRQTEVSIGRILSYSVPYHVL
ncbi:MAG TPA: class I SAM-dependent methyltransferase [Blastocatellia bacterium]|nr:class I SAM-dependent methyltransferase [Blastocatellia bacterium]